MCEQLDKKQTGLKGKHFLSLRTYSFFFIWGKKKQIIWLMMQRWMVEENEEVMTVKWLRPTYTGRRKSMLPQAVKKYD